MKTKFCVFNDRVKPVVLRIDTPNMLSPMDTVQFIQIVPQGMKVVELEIPADTVPYLKIGESGQALLSYISDTI